MAQKRKGRIHKYATCFHPRTFSAGSVPLWIALGLRVLFVAHPESSVFDETHYAAFVGKYLKKEAVVDVHPPLGRLIAYFLVYLRLPRDADPEALGEQLASIRIGQSYIGTALEGTYGLLRAASSVASALSVWMGYITLLHLQVGEWKALLASCFLLFESALHSMGRVFMVDSYLVLCGSSAVYALLRMESADRNTSGKKEDARRMKRDKIKYSAVLGTALGFGAAIKWAFLPLGLPIAFVLLLGLRRAALRRKRGGWKPPVIQGIIIAFSALSIYYAVFLLNFQVQNTYDRKASRWYSREYNAALSGSPLSSTQREKLDSGARVALGISADNRYLSVEKGAFILSHEPENEWVIRSTDGHPVVTASGSVSIQHASGWYLTDGQTGSLISPGPAPLLLARDSPGYVLESPEGKYFSVSPDNVAVWGETPMNLLVLRLGGGKGNGPDTPPALQTSNDSGLYAYSTGTLTTDTVKPLSAFWRFVESNRVMFECGKRLRGGHKYASSALSWLHPVQSVHMWNGGTSETTEASEAYGSSAQIFFMPNPVNATLSVFFLGGYLFYLVLTPIRTAAQECTLMLAYFSTYVPYFFLGRETYLHHYLLSYYVSLAVLGRVLGFFPAYFLCFCVCFSGAMFFVQYPLLVGLPTSYEQCRACSLFSVLPRSGSLHCDLMDGVSSVLLGSTV